MIKKKSQMSSSQSSTTSSTPASTTSAHNPLSNHNHINNLNNHHNNHSTNTTMSASHINSNDQNSSPTKSRVNNLKHSLSNGSAACTESSNGDANVVKTVDENSSFNPKRMRLSESIENINISTNTHSVTPIQPSESNSQVS